MYTVLCAFVHTAIPLRCVMLLIITSTLIMDCIPDPFQLCYCTLQFCKDVWLMFDNAWLYNKKTSRVYKYCTKLRKVFDSVINEAMESLGYCCGMKVVLSLPVQQCFVRTCIHKGHTESSLTQPDPYMRTLTLQDYILEDRESCWKGKLCYLLHYLSALSSVCLPSPSPLLLRQATLHHTQGHCLLQLPKQVRTIAISQQNGCVIKNKSGNFILLLFPSSHSSPSYPFSSCPSLHFSLSPLPPFLSHGLIHLVIHQSIHLLSAVFHWDAWGHDHTRWWPLDCHRGVQVCLQGDEEWFHQLWVVSVCVCVQRRWKVLEIGGAQIMVHA